MGISCTFYMYFVYIKRSACWKTNKAPFYTQSVYKNQLSVP